MTRGLRLFAQIDDAGCAGRSDAGIYPFSNFMDMDLALFERELHMNLVGAFSPVKAATCLDRRATEGATRRLARTADAKRTETAA